MENFIKMDTKKQFSYSGTSESDSFQKTLIEDFKKCTSRLETFFFI